MYAFGRIACCDGKRNSFDESLIRMMTARHDWRNGSYVPRWQRRRPVTTHKHTHVYYEFNKSHVCYQMRCSVARSLAARITFDALGAVCARCGIIFIRLVSKLTFCVHMRKTCMRNCWWDDINMCIWELLAKRACHFVKCEILICVLNISWCADAYWMIYMHVHFC